MADERELPAYPIRAYQLIPATGFVQYGPNTIGGINCVPAAPAAPAPAARKQ
jgi:hypothetical protein